MSDFFKDNLLKNDLVAAPLAGYSFLPFRLILRKFFNGIIYSEMISAEGLARRNAETMEYLDRLDEESPLVFQIFGGKPDSFAEAVKVAENYVKVDAFDINMGCPVKKVLKSGGGCSLLNDLDRLKNIVKSVRKSTDKPFSIKIRIGLDSGRLVYKEILNIAEGEGVDAVAVHCRTKSDMFGGRVRLDILEEIASLAKIAVIGNGGIDGFSSYTEMKNTGVDGIMIGRAMMKAPWIFKAVKDGRDDIYSCIAPEEIGELLFDMWDNMKEHAGNRELKSIHYMHVLRKFAVWFCKGLNNASEFRTRLYQTQDINEVLCMIKTYFADARNHPDSDKIIHSS